MRLVHGCHTSTSGWTTTAHCRSSQAEIATQNYFNLTAVVVPYITVISRCFRIISDFVNPSVRRQPAYSSCLSSFEAPAHRCTRRYTLLPCTISYFILSPRYPYSSHFTAQFSRNWDCQEIHLLINHFPHHPYVSWSLTRLSQPTATSPATRIPTEGSPNTFAQGP